MLFKTARRSTGFGNVAKRIALFHNFSKPFRQCTWLSCRYYQTPPPPPPPLSNRRFVRFKSFEAWPKGTPHYTLKARFIVCVCIMYVYIYTYITIDYSQKKIWPFLLKVCWTAYHYINNSKHYIAYCFIFTLKYIHCRSQVLKNIINKNKDVKILRVVSRQNARQQYLLLYANHLK